MSEMKNAAGLIALLVQRREELELTQTELAARVGVHQAAIARMESGRVMPRLDTAQRIAAALGLELTLSLR